jgi:hypothetical protein
MKEGSGMGFHWFSPIQLISTLVHVWLWLDIPILRDIFNVELDHFRLSRRYTGLGGFFKALTGRSHFSRGTDWAGFDLSIQSAFYSNCFYYAHPKVYYFSFCITQPKERRRNYYCIPGFKFNPLLWLTSFFMGRKRFQKPIYKGFDETQWWQNDGK